MQEVSRQQQQQQQQQQRSCWRREEARSLASLVIVFRSLAHRYYTDREKRTWSERILYDAGIDHCIEETTTDGAASIANVLAVLIRFCTGEFGTREVRNRLRVVLAGRAAPGDRPGDQDQGGVRPHDQRDAEADDASEEEETIPTSTSALNAGARGTDATVRQQPTDEDSDAQRIGIFWSVFCARLRRLTTAVGTTNDGYDARIEFARPFRMNARAGAAVPATFLDSGAAGGEGTVGRTVSTALITGSDFVATLTATNHLNRSMVNNNVTMLDIDTSAPVGSGAVAEYAVYLFGSNCVWTRPTVTVGVIGGDAAVNVPALFTDDPEIRTFVHHLLATDGIVFEPDQEAGRALAAAITPLRSHVVTSISHDDLSLQVAFAVPSPPDSRFYTARIFYARADDTCTADVRYVRRYLSNSCQCSSTRTSPSHWRLMVSLAAFDGGPVDAPFTAAGPVWDFVLLLVRAFQRTKQERAMENDDAENTGGHSFVNHFTGSSALVKTAETPAADYECAVHLWLRAHANPNHWRLVTVVDRSQLLSRSTPRLLVVHRPVLSETCTAVNGPELFLKYRSRDDVWSKYALLSLDTLRPGYDGVGAVAYEGARGHYWLYSTENAAGTSANVRSRAAHSDAPLPRWQRQARSTGVRLLADADANEDFSDSGDDEHFALPPADPRRDVSTLFRSVFAAPSLLYVHRSALSAIGFDASFRYSDTNAKNATRVFLHTDSRSGLDCTVICSSPIVLVDETTGLPSSGNSGVRQWQRRHPHQDRRSLLVLVDSQRPASFLRDNRAAAGIPAFVETTLVEDVVSLNEYWPGVHAVTVSFADRVLRTVHFVFFMAADGNESTGRLTYDGLARLHRYNMRNPTSPVLPPPVLYTLQQFVAVPER